MREQWFTQQGILHGWQDGHGWGSSAPPGLLAPPVEMPQTPRLPAPPGPVLALSKLR